ncbi:lysophospholipid acyltransferase family protein [Aminobacter sp. LjRoot7]|uniref:lysophospholipid acyltransferase family protein n=1 Tax=Aminobacter sp. LjRoot7 TaxID=3342335 RepID=UPI003ED12FEF
MIGKIRTGLALFWMVAASLVLVPLQVISMKTGLWPETVILKIWHRAMLKALGMRVHVVGEMVKTRPLMIASNHISWTDIMAMGSRFDVTFIAKSELSGWPIFGFLSRLQRTVFIERERKRKSGDQASEIARRLAAGNAMVLFAEGSTGDGNMLLPFKSTLFGAASMAIAEGAAEHVVIQPVSIAYIRIHGIPLGRQHRPLASWIGDMDLVPHVGQLLAEGGLDVEIRFGEPIDFSAKSSRKEATRLMEERVREMMLQSLGQPHPSR